MREVWLTSWNCSYKTLEICPFYINKNFKRSYIYVYSIYKQVQNNEGTY